MPFISFSCLITVARLPILCWIETTSCYGIPSWSSEEQSEQPMESQLVWSLEAKIVKGIEKQTVGRLLWVSNVSGTCAGPRLLWSPAWHLPPWLATATGSLEENQINSFLPYQSREDSMKERDHKANANNWETETNYTWLFQRTCILLFTRKDLDAWSRWGE